MNKEIKAQWIAALRSGKYSQGFKRLRTETPAGPKYCCLGVLCELYRQTTGAGSWDINGAFVYEDEQRPSAVLTEKSELPTPVSYWADLADEDDYGDKVAVTDPQLGEHTAAAWNDGNGGVIGHRLAANFEQIADMIEVSL